MVGVEPGVVDIGLRSLPLGVGIRLGVVLPPLGVVLPPLGVVLPPLVGRRLRAPNVKLLVASLYMFGEEEEMPLAALNPLGPLGGREAVGSSFLEEGVLVRSLGDT